MLQQTRVEAVVERYLGFLQAFPDLESLAAAPEEQVIAAWSGLGYYRRARALRAGAALVMARHGGQFPRDPRAARELPGVGPYTAAAVLSIAYGLPLAVVDGNVARVLARLYALEPPGDRSPSVLGDLAQRLLDPESPGDHNQAMMELGARVCTPRNPSCEACPVAGYCRARQTGRAAAYPRARPAVKPSRLDVRVLLLRDPRGLLLLQRNRWRLLRNLWIPPVADVPVLDVPVVDATAAETILGPTPLVPRHRGARGLRRLGAFSHTITTHRIHAEVYGGTLTGKPAESPDTRLASSEDLTGIGRSSFLQKALRLEAASREG